MPGRLITSKSARLDMKLYSGSVNGLLSPHRLVPLQQQGSPYIVLREERRSFGLEVGMSGYPTRVRSLEARDTQ